MSTSELRPVPLTIGQILELTAIVDREREKIRKMIADRPQAKEDNVERTVYINRLDALTRALIQSIG